MIEKASDFTGRKGQNLQLRQLHIADLGCGTGLDVSLGFQVVEKRAENLQQIIDVPRLPLLIVHHRKELFYLVTLDFFNLFDPVFLLQVPL